MNELIVPLILLTYGCITALSLPTVSATSECLDSIFERNEEFEDVHIGTLADMINNSSGSSSWEGKEPRESDTTFSQSMT